MDKAKKPKVYVCYPIMPEVEAALAEFCDFERWTGAAKPTEDDIIAHAEGVEALLVDGANPVSRKVIESLPQVRIVSNASVGYNNFDLPAMKEHGIIGTNVSGALDDSVVDLTIGLIVACGRRFCELDRIVKAGLWKPGSDVPFFGQDVHRRTLGIIGMGRIGENLARRARLGLEMDVLYHNRNRRPEAEKRLGIGYASLDDLLARADYVVLITPATPETYQLMGRAQFARMKPTASFINVSRGPNVDEEALVEALQNRTITSAALDVYKQEPVSPDSPLLKLPNLITLPHIGSATRATRLNMSMTAVENLRQALAGELPALIVPELR